MATGGTIESISGPLSDGSGFAVMSMPLPENHWLYGEQDNIPPSQFGDGEIVILSGDSLFTYRRFLAARKQLGATSDSEPLSRNELREMIRDAGKYAIRTATSNGKYMDFDPDAMLINLVMGFLGEYGGTLSVESADAGREKGRE